jgi:hypothetical protein
MAKQKKISKSSKPQKHSAATKPSEPPNQFIVEFSKVATENPRKTGAPKKYTKEFIEQLAPRMIKWFEKKKNWWLKDFAIQQGFNPRRLDEFAASNETFKDAFEMCKAIQESKLVKMGFVAYKDRFAIFLLKNVAGMRDRCDITSEDQKITAVEITIHKSRNK